MSRVRVTTLDSTEHTYEGDAVVYRWTDEGTTVYDGTTVLATFPIGTVLGADGPEAVPDFDDPSTLGL